MAKTSTNTSNTGSRKSTKTSTTSARKQASKKSTTRATTKRARSSKSSTAAKAARSTSSAASKKHPSSRTRTRATRSPAAKRATSKSAKKISESYSGSRIVPDTSILIEGALSAQLRNAQISISEIIIHEAALAELEAQANRRKETGYLGISEIEELRKLAKVQGFTLRFAGARPEEFEIKFAKSGEIDSIIRALAEKEGAMLYTADIVQSRVAQAKGIPVVLHRHEFKRPKMSIEDFFDDETMSVHIKENCSIIAKRGRPGAWSFGTVRESEASRKEVERWAREIIESAHFRDDGFVEIDRKGSTIAQVGHYRIVITRPPFADGNEITAVRPVKRLAFADYAVSDKLKRRIDEQADGILIAGSPGHGKSTFAQALAGHYAESDKIIKTIEAPRDMVLPEEVAQYAISHGSAEEVHDILLLSRPDYTFFDEMRNTDDFKLFADMRLSGVGMIGVMHATKTIDAIQRFLGRIELGVIPHVVDTVIFIKDGAIASVYAITMIVKVPSGMSEADLARPVVEVHDFESGQLMFEIYTYGEQTVVIPVKKETKKLHTFAQDGLERFFSHYANRPEVEVVSGNRVVVRVDERDKAGLIGKGGERVQALEKEIGMSIDIKSRSEGFEGDAKGSSRSNSRAASGKSLRFKIHETKSSLLVDLGHKLANTSVDIFVNGEFLFTAHASKKGGVKLTKRNKMTRLILDAMDSGDSITVAKSGS